MMKKILLLVVIAIVANLVYAQNPTPEQMYQMNEGALKMVLDYKAQANMNKPRRFVRLFESEDIQIYNDLLGLSTKTAYCQGIPHIDGKRSVISYD